MQRGKSEGYILWEHNNPSHHSKGEKWDQQRDRKLRRYSIGRHKDKKLLWSYRLRQGSVHRQKAKEILYRYKTELNIAIKFYRLLEEINNLFLLLKIKLYDTLKTENRFSIG